MHHRSFTLRSLWNPESVSRCGAGTARGDSRERLRSFRESSVMVLGLMALACVAGCQTARTPALLAVPQPGSPRLYAAAKEGNTGLVERLLRRGADTSVATETGATPLHAAAASGHIAVVRLLLKHGAPVEAQDDEGARPLHYACGEQAWATMQIAPRNRGKVLRALAAAGSDLDARRAGGQTPLYDAIRFGNTELARVLVGLGADPNAGVQVLKLGVAQDGGSTGLPELPRGPLTPLHLAAFGPDVRLVETLVEAGADLNARDGLGRTPLHLAALAGRSEAIRTLVSHGAAVDARDRAFTRWDAYSDPLTTVRMEMELARPPTLEEWKEPAQTALHYAAHADKPAAVRTLLSAGADIEATTDSGATAVHVAANRGSLGALGALIESGAELNARIEMGRTPLHAAAEGFSEGAVHDLLTAGADPHAVDRNGQTALHLAVRMKTPGRARTGNSEAGAEARAAVLNRLLRGGCPIDRRDLIGWTAHDYARALGRSEAAALLQAHGSSTQFSTVPEQTARRSELVASVPGSARILALRQVGAENVALLFRTADGLRVSVFNGPEVVWTQEIPFAARAGDVIGVADGVKVAVLPESSERIEYFHVTGGELVRKALSPWSGAHRPRRILLLSDPSGRARLVACGPGTQDGKAGWDIYHRPADESGSWQRFARGVLPVVVGSSDRPSDSIAYAVDGKWAVTATAKGAEGGFRGGTEAFAVWSACKAEDDALWVVWDKDPFPNELGGTILTEVRDGKAHDRRLSLVEPHPVRPAPGGGILMTDWVGSYLCVGRLAALDDDEYRMVPLLHGPDLAAHGDVKQVRTVCTWKGTLHVMWTSETDSGTELWHTTVPNIWALLTDD